MHKLQFFTIAISVLLEDSFLAEFDSTFKYDACIGLQVELFSVFLGTFAVKAITGPFSIFKHKNITLVLASLLTT